MSNLRSKPHEKPNCRCEPCKIWLAEWKQSTIDGYELELAVLEYKKQTIEAELKVLKAPGTLLILP